MKPGTPPPLRSVRLFDQMRERIRYCHYSLRTEQAYLFWVRRFIRFHRLRHPRSIGSAEVARLLEQVEPTFAAMVALLYCAGLRLMECPRLRVKDVDSRCPVPLPSASQETSEDWGRGSFVHVRLIRLTEQNH